MTKFYIVIAQMRNDLYLGYDYMKNIVIEIVTGKKLKINELIEVQNLEFEKNNISLESDKIKTHGVININKLFNKVIVLNILSRFNPDIKYLDEFLAKKKYVDDKYIIVFLDDNLNKAGNSRAEMYKLLNRRAKLFHNEKTIRDWYLFRIKDENKILEFNCICKLNIDNSIADKLKINDRSEYYFNLFELNYNQIFKSISKNDYLKGLMLENSIYELFDKIFRAYAGENKVYITEDINKKEFVTNYRTVNFENQLIEYILELKELDYKEENYSKNEDIILEDLDIEGKYDYDSLDDIPF